ncbi:MAG: hypothetical protein ACOCX4_07445 [Planctomycetota bacterium]
MRHRIPSLGVLQTGKVVGALYALAALLGLPFLLIGAVTPSEGGFLLLFLLLYPVIGFIGGLIFAVLYNLASKWTGGLEVTLETIEEQ